MLMGVVPTGVFALDDTTVATLITSEGQELEFSNIVECFDSLSMYKDSTVKLTKDITINDGDYILISGEGISFTLDFNGYTIKGNSDDSSFFTIDENITATFKDSVGTGGLTNESTTMASSCIFTANSNLTIDSGNYIGTQNTLCVFGNTTQVVINGGVFEANSGKNAVTLYGGYTTVNGGIFKGDFEFSSDNMFYNTYGDGIIYGGEFNGINGKKILDVIADGYGAFDAEGNEIIITELQSSIADYFTVKESSTERDYVAKVVYDDGTEKSFISFEEAVTELLKKRYIDYKWHQDNTLVLLKDIVIDETINRNSVGHLSTKYNIDLNGHTLQNSSDNLMPIFLIDIYSTVTIKDSVGAGKIYCYNSSENAYGGANDYKNAAAILNYGNLILDNVTIEFKGIDNSAYKYTYCINNLGNLEIKNANLTNNDNLGGALLNGYYKNGDRQIYGKAVIYGGVFTGNKLSLSHNSSGELTLYGGVYNGTLLADNALDIIAEGYGYFDEKGESNIVLDKNNQITDTKFTVKNIYPVSVTNPNGVTEYYGSLAFAYAESPKDSILKLLALVVEGGDLPIDFKTTIDLNGKTLNTENGVTVSENGDLVITDSQDNGQINGGVTVNGGTLDVQAGTINSNANGVTNENGNVTISGGEINGAEGYSDISVSGDNTTTIKGGSYPDGFSMSGATINDTLDGNYAFYDEDTVVVEVGNNQMTISGNVVVYEKSIISAMSSQIRFGLNEDNSFAGTVDIRTRAKISDADFNKYIADTNDDAELKIKAAGFVYTTSDKTFDIDVAKAVARGETTDGYVNAPVSHIQDADGYYMFTCLVKNIPESDLSMGIHSYAYICVNDIWYFFPTITTTQFNELYSTYYPLAAEKYGWEV